MQPHRPGQQQPHPDLEAIVRNHLDAPWRRPIADHSAQAFAEIRHRVETSGRSLILDSCCGTGDSTRYLAATYPQALVVGVDKSASRLSRRRSGDHDPDAADNCVLVRADVNDFWRLAVDAGWRPERHFLLYPNPYPKASQLRKRWYGSPAFAALIDLGGLLTVRTNWGLYAEEFVLALQAAGFHASQQVLANPTLITAFETKYFERGHDLYELVSDLNRRC